MAAYNVQSLFIFFAIFSLLGGVVACLYFKRLDTSARYWVVATLLTGSTNLITVFRAELPLLWAYSIPIGLSCAGYVLMGMGMVKLYKPAPLTRQLLVLAVGTVAFIVLMEWCRIHAGPRVTLLLSGGMFGLTALWGAYPTHVHYKLTSNPFSKHLRWIMAALGLFHLVRTQGAITGWGIQTFGQDAWTLGIWSAIFVMGALRYFGYVAVRVQQQANDRLKMVAALAKEEEGRRLGAQLARQERQLSLGMMSASFAHELNQPLTVIRNYAELLQHQQHVETLTTATTQDLLDDIIASSVRAAEIIRRIRNFIQPAVPRKERIDLREVVLEVFELVGAEAVRARTTLNKPSMDTPMWVQADPIELSQVLFNVMRNAMDALHDAAERRIDLELFRADGEVQIWVYDTGTGLSEQGLEQVGEPFYTTKPSGLGMGLSISKSILAQYGGRLTLSNTERGTCAKICLPLSPSA